MNQKLLTDRWDSIRSDLRNTWKDLSPQELEETQGRFPSLVSLFQERYGYSEIDARNTLNRYLSQYEKTMADKVGPTNTPNNKAITEKEEEHKVMPTDIPHTQRPF